MAKLVRDRSTPEQDQWWSAVSRAAQSAPKLTYEREFAPMTNADDLIERARLAQKMVPRAIDVFEQAVFIGSVIDDLAAALREARRDSERLDYAIEHGLLRVYYGEPGQRYSREANRSDLDDAMGESEND